MSRIHRNTRLRRTKLFLERLERRQVLATYFVGGLVSGSGEGTEVSPFATIRQGIEAALHAQGDDEVVIIPRASGPYTDPIAITPTASPEQVRGFTEFNGNLIIRGSTGNASDIVLQSQFASGIYIDAPIDVTIQDLTISSSGIHGVLNRSDNAVVLDNLIIKDHLHQGSNGPYGWSGVIHQGANLTVRNSELHNNWQGIWSGLDGSVEPKIMPGSLTVENTISRNNYYQGIYANSLTDGLTLIDYSGLANGDTGIAADNIGTVSITGGSFSNNRHKGMSLNGVQGATIDGVLVEGNGSPNLTIGTGGAGIRVWPVSSDPIIISNSVIRKNATNRWGGGFEMYNMNSAAAPTITFLNSELSDNTSPNDSAQQGRGGGISVYGYGNLEILDSKILRNQAGIGGGIFHQTLLGNNHYLKIDGSTIQGNSSYFNGGLDRLHGQTSITNSTFSGNSSSNGAGGLRVNNSRGSMTNVTVSNNNSVLWSGGMTLLSGSAFQITNSTIVNNSGSNVGGLYMPSQGLLTNNVIAANRETALNTSSPDVLGYGQSGGGNFIGDATGANLFNSQTDFVGTSANPLDPRLGSLQDNGGKTLTHLPLPGSPLIDAGVEAVYVTRAEVVLPTTDQRGVARPQREGYDIGAVEIANRVPVVDVDLLTITVDEGQVAVNSGTFSDFEGDAVALSVSLGTVTLGANGTWQWSHETADGPSQSTTVVLTATDYYGAVSDVEFELVVINVAPTAQVSATSSILSGDTATLLLSATDPSSADIDAGFSYRIDWDSDGDIDQVVDGSDGASYVFTELGEHTITVQAVDKDGGVSAPVTTMLTVLPVPIDLIAETPVNLNPVKNGNKTIQIVVPSTFALDARTLEVATVTWAGAGVYRASYRDVDSDGDTDAVFEFLLSESDALDMYREALAADRDNSHHVLTTELRATGSRGVKYLGAAQVDFFMTGKALKDLLASIS